MSDYPDRFGVQQFPSFGTFSKAGAITSCPAGATTKVFEVLTKGHIYGGYLWIEDTNCDVLSRFHYYIDDVLIWQLQFDAALEQNLTEPGVLPMVLLRYDTVAGGFVVGLSKDVTFNSSMRIDFQNTGADAINVNYNLFYASVE